jgi:hypothetical protein
MQLRSLNTDKYAISFCSSARLTGGEEEQEDEPAPAPTEEEQEDEATPAPAPTTRARIQTRSRGTPQVPTVHNMTPQLEAEMRKLDMQVQVIEDDMEEEVNCAISYMPTLDGLFYAMDEAIRNAIRFFNELDQKNNKTCVSIYTQNETSRGKCFVSSNGSH